MRSSRPQQPPALADKFLRWFCRGELQEEILGDLHELYDVDLAHLPRWRVHLIYWYQLLHFLRPFALKRKRQNSNTVMIKSHLKFAWRNILKHQGSALTNVFSLAVGIACFMFVFIYLRQELSYDRFHADSDRIHRVAIDFVTATGDRIPDATTPPALAPALVQDFPEVESSVRLFPSWGNKFLFEREGNKFYEEGYLRTDSTFFNVFTFKAIHGDLSSALDSKDQLVLTRSTALKFFGEENVVGRTLILHGDEPRTLRISAVLEDVPVNSHFKFNALGRIPFDNLETNWGWYNYYTYMKVHPSTEMSTMEPKLQPFYEGYVEGDEYYNVIYSQPLTDIHLKSHLKWELEANGDMGTVYILSGLGLFVLIISCLNYLNLTVAESLKRFKEVGVRKVFGAQKMSLINQFIVETLLLTVIALILGSVFAELLFLGTQELLGREITILSADNLTLLGWLALFVLFIALLAGLYPALHISQFQTILAIKGLVARSGKSAIGLRKVLLTIQFAISAFMIFGTIAVFQQLRHMQLVDKGFSSEQVLIVENGSSITNQKALKTELLQLSNVRSAGISNGVIGGLNWTTSVGYPDAFLMNYLVVDPGFVETLDLELIEGRNFDNSRETDKQGFTMIVNETAFTELGLSFEDLGKSVPLLQQNDTTILNGVVIGVLKDFHFTDFKLGIKPFAFVYRESPLDYINLKLQTADLSQTLDQIEEVWARFSDNAPMEYYFLDQSFSELYAQENRLSKILIYLTVLAFFIAFIGMFAIANLTIKDKRKEIAVRKVLGASVSGVTNLITGKFLLLVLIANAVALPASYYFMREWLNGFTYRTSLGVDLFVFAVGSTMLVAAVIVGVQSIKAATGNPVVSLRQE